MKKVVSLALVAITAVTAKAQTEKVWGQTAADSVKCWENYNIAGSYYKSKSYADAYDAWYQLYQTCPGAKENTFKIAPKIVEAKIKAEQDPATKMEIAKVLIEQYNVRLQYFPGNEGFVKTDKAAKYNKYFKDSLVTGYKLFQEAFEVAGNDMYPHHLNSYFNAAVRMYKADNIELDQLLADYNFINEALDYNVNKYNRDVEELQTKKDSGQCDAKCEKYLTRNTKILDGYDKVQRNINKMIAPVLSCTNLAKIYNEEAFELNKGDATWLKTAATMLEKEKTDDEGNRADCTDNPIYFSVAEALYALEPSAQAARSMARLAYSKKEYSTSIKYYEEAINLEEDDRKKSKDYLKLAVIQQKKGSLASAKSSALKAASLNKKWGDPYLVLASVYGDAAGTCGSNAIEKNAVYWAAINKLNYAKSIDPTVTSKANSLISAYKKALPDLSTAFALGIKEGDTINIGCWINETVTVKFY